jgi:hypothetical protein
MSKFFGKELQDGKDKSSSQAEVQTRHQELPRGRYRNPEHGRMFEAGTMLLFLRGAVRVLLPL